MFASTRVKERLPCNFINSHIFVVNGINNLRSLQNNTVDITHQCHSVVAASWCRQKRTSQSPSWNSSCMLLRRTLTMMTYKEEIFVNRIKKKKPLGARRCSLNVITNTYYLRTIKNRRAPQIVLHKRNKNTTLTKETLRYPCCSTVLST